MRNERHYIASGLDWTGGNYVEGVLERGGGVFFVNA